jgi:hypothetical protein
VSWVKDFSTLEDEGITLLQSLDKLKTQSPQQHLCGNCMPRKGENVSLREYKDTEIYIIPKSLVANHLDNSHKINGEILPDSLYLRIENTLKFFGYLFFRRCC